MEFCGFAPAMIEIDSYQIKQEFKTVETENIQNLDNKK